MQLLHCAKMEGGLGRSGQGSRGSIYLETPTWTSSSMLASNASLSAFLARSFTSWTTWTPHPVVTSGAYKWLIMSLMICWSTMHASNCIRNLFTVRNLTSKGDSRSRIARWEAVNRQFPSASTSPPWCSVKTRDLASVGCFHSTPCDATFFSACNCSDSRPPTPSHSTLLIVLSPKTEVGEERVSLDCSSIKLAASGLTREGGGGGAGDLQTSTIVSPSNCASFPITTTAQRVRRSVTHCRGCEGDWEGDFLFNSRQFRVAVMLLVRNLWRRRTLRRKSISRMKKVGLASSKEKIGWKGRYLPVL